MATVSGGPRFALVDAGRCLVLLAIGLFVAAAVIALRIAQPVAHDETKVQGLYDLIADEALWKSDDLAGMRSASQNRVEVIESFSSANARKADFLRYALWSQVGAVIAVSLAIALSLYTES